MSTRGALAAEIAFVAVVAIGVGLVYLPAGVIVFGALMLLGMQGFRPRNDRTGE